MLEHAVLELERIAPITTKTRRARRALEGFKLPSWMWGVWAALGCRRLGHSRPRCTDEHRELAWAITNGLLAWSPHCSLFSF